MIAQRKIQPYKIDPAATIRFESSLVDLCHDGDHISLDWPDTGIHDDAFHIRKLGHNLFVTTISVPAAAQDTTLDLRNLPRDYVASAPGRLSLSTGPHRVLAARILSSVDTIYDTFVFPATISTRTFKHRMQFQVGPDGEFKLDTYGRRVPVESLHPTIPERLRSGLLEVTGQQRSEAAVEQLMLMQWQAIGTLLATKGIVAPYRSNAKEWAGNQCVQWAVYSAEPVADYAAVPASSPLRKRVHLIGLRQVESLVDKSIECITPKAMQGIANLATMQSFTKATKDLAKASGVTVCPIQTEYTPEYLKTIRTA